MRRFFLLTGADLPEGHSDDQALATRLGQEGDVQWLDWTRPQLRSGQSVESLDEGICLIRTPWDYQHNMTGFLNGLSRLVDQGLQLWNPLDTVRWNIDKTYLLELQALGINTVPTASGDDFLKHRSVRGSSVSHYVIKPRIGASGLGVRIVEDLELSEHLGSERDPGHFLVQPVIASVETEGESSLIFYRIHDRPVFSHAIRKRPARGEFRVQAEFGSHEEPEIPRSTVLSWAEEIIDLVERTLKHRWIYCRVDLLFQDGQPILSELEFIEPQLFHRFGPNSEDLLTRALLEHL